MQTAFGPRSIPSLTAAAHRPLDESFDVRALDRPVLESGFGIRQLANDAARLFLMRSQLRAITVVLKQRPSELLELVNSGLIKAARTLVTSAGAAVRDPLWAALLEPPVTTARPKSGLSDFKRNADWLRRNRTSFRGAWVAVYNGQLVDHDKSRLALHHRLEGSGRLVQGTLFAKVD